MRNRGALALLGALVLAASCGAAPRTATAPSSGTPALSPRATATQAGVPITGSASPTARPLPHVFVIVMENTGLSRALRSAPIAALASRYALATDYHAVARPSLPNYLALTSGSTWGITDDGYHVLPAGGIGAQLTSAGIRWRAYMEGMTAAGCMRSPYPYALKHDPFAYYGGGCPENVVPLDSLDADLAGATPSFVWITPDLCHDGHDCPIDQAGAWLETMVSRIVSSTAWDDRAVLFIVWDEGDGLDANLVPLIVATKDALPQKVEGRYDHYSVLATIEDAFGLPRLGAAGTARPIAGLFSSGGR